MQPVWAGHPWIYAQAIARVEGGARAGDEVRVVDPQGKFLGRGFYSPASAIPVRILVRDETTLVSTELFRQRLLDAQRLRQELRLPSDHTNGYRLVHAEGDALPGLIVDVYDDQCVVQVTTLGMKQREGLWLEALQEVLHPRAIINRTSADVARREGFSPSNGVLRGEETAPVLRFRERGFAYEIPTELTQKTGFYFDQRPLRARVETLAHGARVLDAFSFVGTFALAAARGGAKEVTAVDENAVALEVAAETARRNGYEGQIRYLRDDARNVLRQAAETDPYDVVLCDPPKLAPTRMSRDGGLQAYRKLAELGCRATVPGGLLVLCSCSATVSMDGLTRALALGARTAGVRATILERHFQGADHPVPASFPEGLYLKSLLVRLGTLLVHASSPRPITRNVRAARRTRI